MTALLDLLERWAPAALCRKEEPEASIAAEQVQRRRSRCKRRFGLSTILGGDGQTRTREGFDPRLDISLQYFAEHLNR
jgi:hypothetical protein